MGNGARAEGMGGRGGREGREVGESEWNPLSAFFTSVRRV